jgi:hypothetical protein
MELCIDKRESNKNDITQEIIKPVKVLSAHEKNEEQRLTALAAKRYQKSKGNYDKYIVGLQDLPNHTIISTKDNSAIILDCSNKTLDFLNKPGSIDTFYNPLIGPLITNVDLSNNKIHLLPLDLLLNQCPNVQSLNVKKNKIGAVSMNGFTKEKNTKLLLLDMSHNRINNRSIIEDIIVYYQGLRLLNLKKNLLNQTDIIQIFKYLEYLCEAMRLSYKLPIHNPALSSKCILNTIELSCNMPKPDFNSPNRGLTLLCTRNW